MNKTFIREPAVAGRFYPANAQDIQKQLDNFIEISNDKKNCIGCMLPHAGYMYSAKVAVQTAARVVVKDTVVLLGPKHTALGADFSLMQAGTWRTPMGDISIDKELAKEILASSHYLQPDEKAHALEHSIEVELPILQYFRKDFKIVPIAFGSDNFDALTDVGNAVVMALKNRKQEESTLLVASSDMTHYEPAAVARKKDDLALHAILNLDARLLWESVKRNGISMCGYMPVIVMITAAKALGATKAELVKYSTSGDVTTDNSSVVGYAGVIVY